MLVQGLFVFVLHKEHVSLALGSKIGLLLILFFAFQLLLALPLHLHHDHHGHLILLTCCVHEVAESVHAIHWRIIGIRLISRNRTKSYLVRGLFRIIFPHLYRLSTYQETLLVLWGEIIAEATFEMMRMRESIGRRGIPNIPALLGAVFSIRRRGWDRFHSLH